MVQIRLKQVTLTLDEVNIIFERSEMRSEILTRATKETLDLNLKLKYIADSV